MGKSFLMVSTSNIFPPTSCQLLRLSCPCRQLRVNCLSNPLLDSLKGDSFHHRLEEALHHHVLSLRAWDPTSHEIEQLLLVDGTDGGTVGAAHVVVLDLQLRHRVGSGVGAQCQIAIRLVSIGLEGVLVHTDQPRELRSGVVRQRYLIQQVAGAVGPLMVLQCVICLLYTSPS